MRAINAAYRLDNETQHSRKQRQSREHQKGKLARSYLATVDGLLGATSGNGAGPNGPNGRLGTGSVERTVVSGARVPWAVKSSTAEYAQRQYLSYIERSSQPANCAAHACSVHTTGERGCRGRRPNPRPRCDAPTGKLRAAP